MIKKIFAPLWAVQSKLTGITRCHAIAGGLGNQMFQYAFALALREKYPAPAALDLSHFDKCKDHNGWEIEDVFTLPDRLAQPGRRRLWWFTKLSKRAGFVTKEDDSLAYRAALFSSARKGISSGYWPSFRYFAGAEETVRKNFVFRRAGELEGHPALEEIRNSESVSLHVRRGDYLAAANAAFFTGICTEAYYSRAIALIKAKVPSAKFFVFSNDPAWCRTCFTGPEFRVIDGFPGKDSWKDMYLMSQCRHSILANSSFSWWGMWLGRAAGRIAIGPDRLLNDGLVRSAIEDFLPEQVVRISPAGIVVHDPEKLASS